VAVDFGAGVERILLMEVARVVGQLDAWRSGRHSLEAHVEVGKKIPTEFALGIVLVGRPNMGRRDTGKKTASRCWRKTWAWCPVLKGKD
jgi:hypothetical protein